MTVVLDIRQAKLLADQAVKLCGPSAVVSAVVMLLGGKQIADATSAPWARASLVRDVCVMASMARADIVEVPQDWTERQPEPVVQAPKPIGAALRIFSRTGTAADPNVQAVGIIGLLGVEPEQAVEVLNEVITSNGFLRSP